jgi:hypothetical protein
MAATSRRKERMTMARYRTKPKLTLRNTVLTRVARRIAVIHAEISYAQLRVDAMRTNPDLYLADPGKMPETYAEFLFRTSGVLVREPIAMRAAGSSPEVLS